MVLSTIFSGSLAAVDTVTVDSGYGMSIVAWLVLGLVAGFIASKLVNKTGEGIVLDIVLGIVGAMVGGFVMRSLNIGGGVSGLNIASLFVAVVGAVIVLLVFHMVRGTSNRTRVP